MQAVRKPNVDKRLASTIAQLRTLTGVRDGYALVLGTRDGWLAEHLAADTNLNVIALASAESDADAIRRRILEPSMPASRVSIVTGRLEEVVFPPYLADLIVIEDSDATGLNTGPEFLLTLYDRLKPYGGLACLAVAPTRDHEIQAWLREAGHGEAQVERNGDLLLVRRAGALPGAVDYTNDWKAPDARVRAPLGILWFADSVASFKRAPQPMIVGGVMISQDKDWQGKAEKMGHVNHLHRDGTGRFRLLKETYMDVYTGRVMSLDEAESRLEQIPNTLSAEFRPPYQFRPPYVEAHLQELESRGEKQQS